MLNADWIEVVRSTVSEIERKGSTAAAGRKRRSKIRIVAGASILTHVS